MGLQKSFELRNGTQGNYMRISDVNYKNGSNDCVIKVQYWKDKTTRETSGKVPMDESNVSILLGDGLDIMQRSYEGLKALSDFSGAVDV